MTGRVFNIQRFSIHDGPGIRTTVFLKGCSLACAWCHNPESIAPEPELAFLPHKCIGCGRCVAACETGALSLQDGQRRTRPDLCRRCGRCARACYAEALVLQGQDLTVDEVMEEVLKDCPFYNQSRGGATLSGGEPLLQADFAASLLARCHEQAIHTCVDTAAHVPWDAFAATLPHTDLVLLDLKLVDPQRHREATGAPNDRILDNARRLGRGPRPLVVRVPIIPGHTDDEANLTGIADLARQLPALQRIELLPYHRFAESKYQRLGRPYALQGTEAPSRERLHTLQALVARCGVAVRVA